jgi:hypothetical protein
MLYTFYIIHLLYIYVTKYFFFKYRQNNVNIFEKNISTDLNIHVS